MSLAQICTPNVMRGSTNCGLVLFDTNTPTLMRSPASFDWRLSLAINTPNVMPSSTKVYFSEGGTCVVCKCCALPRNVDEARRAFPSLKNFDWKNEEKVNYAFFSNCLRVGKIFMFLLHLSVVIFSANSGNTPRMSHLRKIDFRL